MTIHIYTVHLEWRQQRRRLGASKWVHPRRVLMPHKVNGIYTKTHRYFRRSPVMWTNDRTKHMNHRWKCALCACNSTTVRRFIAITYKLNGKIHSAHLHTLTLHTQTLTHARTHARKNATKNDAKGRGTPKINRSKWKPMRYAMIKCITLRV